MSANSETNPEGGGGNQFNPLFVLRQGEYGDHHTMSGKIVYRRPRHNFSTEDLLRVIPRVAAAEEAGEIQENKFAWWERAINFLAEYMLQKITGIVSLNDQIPKIIWAWINKIYFSALLKIGRIKEWERLHRIYKNRLELAVKEYTEDGDYTALTDLMNRLTMKLKE